jgi:hypothetical protein
MTDHHDDVTAIGTVGDPFQETSSDRPRHVPVVSIGLAVVAVVALALSTRPSESATSDRLPELPLSLSSSTTTTTTPSAPQPVRLAFDRAPFDALLPAWAVSDGGSTWVFSAAQSASGDRRGTGLIAHSTGGGTWVEHGVVIDDAVEVWSVEHSGGWFTAAAVTRAEPFGQVIYASPDGVEWRRLQPPEGRASLATGGLPGLLVITYPYFDDMSYRRAIDALPEEVRVEVESGRLAWWFDGSEVVVGIGSLQLGRFPLRKLDDPAPTDSALWDEPPTIWLVEDGGTTWTRQKPTERDFWPNKAVTLDDGTVILSGWTGEQTVVLVFNGTGWTELEGLGSLGLAAQWKGWFLTARGAQIMASRDLASWEVVLQIHPDRQSLVQLYSGPNNLVATHTTDLVLTTIEPTGALLIGDVHVVFDYASLTVVQNGETLVRHGFTGRQDGVAALDGDNVVVFGVDGSAVVRIPLDDVGAVWRNINDQYRPQMRALLASDLRTWVQLDLPFRLSPEGGSVAVGEQHLVMIERSTDTETASIWVGQIES